MSPRYCEGNIGLQIIANGTGISRRGVHSVVMHLRSSTMHLMENLWPAGASCLSKSCNINRGSVPPIQNCGSAAACGRCSELLSVMQDILQLPVATQWLIENCNAGLFQPDALAAQTAMLTAGLMVTSAALGFSARSLVDALVSGGEREDITGPAEAAWEQSYEAPQSSADAWHMPPVLDVSGPESSTVRESETLSSFLAAESALPAVTTPESSCTPEHLWNAAWQGFEPTIVPVAQSNPSGQPVDRSPGWLRRLRGSREASRGQFR